VYSHAEGRLTEASGEASHTEGKYTQAISEGAHAEGRLTEASGEAAHAEGQATAASGNYSHAEGYVTLSINHSAHAEGMGLFKLEAITFGNYASTEAPNLYQYNFSNLDSQAGVKPGSILEVKLSGKSYYLKVIYIDTINSQIKFSALSNSFPINELTSGTSGTLYTGIASGAASHTEGHQTTASGEYSHAGGYHTIAGYQSQTVIGKYNDNKSNALFEVGNGTSENTRSNAFEVYQDGHAEVGLMGDTNKSVATKEYVDSKENLIEIT